MTSFTQCLIWLVLLALVDIIIPVPFAALLLIYVLLYKPPWFKKIVETVYQ